MTGDMVRVGRIGWLKYRWTVRRGHDVNGQRWYAPQPYAVGRTFTRRGAVRAARCAIATADATLTA